MKGCDFMKIKKQKIISFICVIIIFFITNLTQTNAIGNNAYTVINSHTLLETNTLDSLELNYSSLPSITVSGSEKYTVTNTTSLVNTSIPVKQVQFPNATKGKILDSIITVKFNNCGKLNGKNIDMKLVYSDIVTKGNNPLLYWSAYGTSMSNDNEWWYRLIEHVTVKIYFYYSGSSTPLTLNTTYLSIFSEDPNERSIFQYIFE